MRQTQEKTKRWVFLNAFTGDTIFLSKDEVRLLDKGEGRERVKNIPLKDQPVATA